MNFIKKLFCNKTINSIDIQHLKEIAAFLEQKPEMNFRSYDSRVDEVLSSLGYDTDYMSKHDKIKDKDISTLTLDDLKVMYTFITRSERFCDGSIVSYVADGTILKLLNREIELLS